MVQRDVAPHVAVEVDQDGVEAGDTVEQLGDIVVRLNLGGVRVPLNSQGGHELFTELMPVHFRVSGNMGVVVTYRAIDFTKDLNLFQLTILTLHTVCHVSHLFTHRGWRSGLTMGSGEQGNVAVFHRQRFHRVNDFTPVR